MKQKNGVQCKLKDAQQQEGEKNENGTGFFSVGVR